MKKIHINISPIRTNQTGFSFTSHCPIWNGDFICAVVLNRVSIPFEYSSDRWAAIILNTCSCVPLQKQTTTIILISALLRPLQQSSRPSSEDTRVSPVYRRDYLKHIVSIVWCSPSWFCIRQQYQQLAFKMRSTLSIIREQSWNHHHGEVKQNKDSLEVHH